MSRVIFQRQDYCIREYSLWPYGWTYALEKWNPKAGIGWEELDLIVDVTEKEEVIQEFKDAINDKLTPKKTESTKLQVNADLCEPVSNHTLGAVCDECFGTGCNMCDDE